MRQVVDYYHETLKPSPEALRYLESRGLTHPGTRKNAAASI
jgi:DNA primase